MAQLVMDRRASENKYLHRDFHISMDRGCRYVVEKYGYDALLEYLKRFTVRFYQPLFENMKKDGLKPLAEEIQRVYEVEEASDDLKIVWNGDSDFTVYVEKCPAVTHFKKSNYAYSEYYIECTRAVNRFIAEETGFKFEMYDYDNDTGKTSYRFYK